MGADGMNIEQDLLLRKLHVTKSKEAKINATELDTRLVMRPLKIQKVLNNSAVEKLLEKKKS